MVLNIVDTSIIVNGHSEGYLIRATLKCAHDAMLSYSFSVELLIVLDSADELTEHVVTTWVKENRQKIQIRIVRTEFGDVSSARNFGAQKARGEYVLFCDGDDLFSPNYLSEGRKLAALAKNQVVFHPEYVISFGNHQTIWHIGSKKNQRADFLDLIQGNLWPSTSFASREIYLKNPYKRTIASDGFGPEDWLWNIDTTTAGVKHQAISGVYFFYRTKSTAGVNNSHQNSVLPFFDIEGLAKMLPRKKNIGLDTFFTGISATPAVGIWLKKVIRDFLRLFGNFVSPTARRFIFLKLRQFQTDPATETKSILDLDAPWLKRICEVEPAISNLVTRINDVPFWEVQRDRNYSEVLYFLITRFASNSDKLVTVPWIGVGGADAVALNYAKALSEFTKKDERINVLATQGASMTKLELIPANLNFIQIPDEYFRLDSDLQKKVFAQFIILTKIQLVVSVNSPDVVLSLGKYFKALGNTADIFLSMFSFDLLEGKFPVNPITNDSEREFLKYIRGFLTDNSVTKYRIKDVLGVGENQIYVHRQPAFETVPNLDKSTVAYNQYVFNAASPFRIVWPHRLDHEKRPDALVKIADMCSKLRLPVEFHVFGSQVLSSNLDSLLRDFNKSGIIYHGPYTGGLSNLDLSQFHALLLTSAWEGMPNVLPQSLQLSIPVIATNVGGVSDTITDRETGLLVSEPDSTDEFVEAILALMNDKKLRQKIINKGFNFSSKNYVWKNFLDAVDEDLLGY